MKLIAAAAVLASLTVAAESAQASSITYDVRSIDHGVFAQPTYADGWAAQTTAITSQSLGDFNGSTGRNNGYDRLTVDFTVSAAHAGSALFFQIAPDAGYGGELYLDGALLDQQTADLWWAYDWGNAGEVLEINGIPVAKGKHTLQAFWAEGCCNGWQGGRFSLDGQNWQGLSLADLDALAVPEPGTIPMLGIALAGLLVLRRKPASGQASDA